MHRFHQRSLRRRAALHSPRLHRSSMERSRSPALLAQNRSLVNLILSRDREGAVFAEYDATLKLVATSPLQALPGFSRGLFFLGNHVSRHSHVTGDVSAADAGLRALPPSRAALLVCSRWLRGMPLPRGRELAAACFSGFLMLGIGNGALVFAEVTDSQRNRRSHRHHVAVLDGWRRSAVARRRAAACSHRRARWPWVWRARALLFTPDFGRAWHRPHFAQRLPDLQSAWPDGRSAPSISDARPGKRIPWSPAECNNCRGIDPRAVRACHPPAPHSLERARVSAPPLPGNVRIDCRLQRLRLCLDRLPVAIVSVYPYVNAVVAVVAGLAVLPRAVRMAGSFLDDDYLLECCLSEEVFAKAGGEALSLIAAH